MMQSIFSCIVGLWLIVSPALLQTNKAVADNNHIIGPLVITFSVIAFWKLNRLAVKLNFVFGLWLVISLLVFDYSRTFPFLSNGVCGLLLVLAAITVKKKYSNSGFGGGWRSLIQHNPPHVREAFRKGNAK